MKELLSKIFAIITLVASIAIVIVAFILDNKLKKTAADSMIMNKENLLWSNIPNSDIVYNISFYSVSSDAAAYLDTFAGIKDISVKELNKPFAFSQRISLKEESRTAGSAVSTNVVYGKKSFKMMQKPLPNDVLNIKVIYILLK